MLSNGRDGLNTAISESSARRSQEFDKSTALQQVMHQASLEAQKEMAIKQAAALQASADTKAKALTEAAMRKADAQLNVQKMKQLRYLVDRDPNDKEAAAKLRAMLLGN